MNKNFELTISTPAGTVFNGEVKSITFTSEGGELQVMANHASITTNILFSPVRVDHTDGSDEYAARRGLFFFDNAKNRAVLLALYAEQKADMDLKTAKEYLEFVEQKLREGADLSDFQIQYLEGQKLAVEQQLGGADS